MKFDAGAWVKADFGRERKRIRMALIELGLVADAGRSYDHLETLLHDPAVGKQLGAFYGAMDPTTSTQMFIRDVTPDLLKALRS